MYEHLQRFFDSVAPALRNVVPVGTRDVLDAAIRLPDGRLGQVLQAAASVWPAGFAASALSGRIRDPKDAHVCLACIENRADVLVTSDLEHFAALQGFCEVEPPSAFVRRVYPFED